MPRRRPYDNPFMRIISRLKDSSRDMMVFAFCLLVSGGFWMLQKLDDTFEADIKVPLELTGVPSDVIITTPLPEQITFTVRDRGTNLVHYMRSVDIRKPIVLDYSVYDNGGKTGVAHIPMTDIQRIFQQSLLTSTLIQRIRPDTLQFCYNHGRSRMLPIKFCGKIRTTSHNYLQYVKFQHDSVRVYAPDAVLDTMRYAYINPVNVKGLSKTQDFEVTFRNINGVQYTPSTMQMTAHIDYYTEQSCTVPITGTNFPAGIDLKTFPGEVTVTYRVGAANADMIKPSNFVIAITYEQLLKCSGGRFTPHIKSTPIGVSNIRINPRQVDFLLEETTTEE